MISNDNLVHDLVSAISIGQPSNFDMWVFKGKEAAVVETENELAYSGTSDSIQACQPSSVLKVARETVALTLNQKVSYWWMMRCLF